MSSIRLYPGMCDGALEIFFNHELNELMAINNGRIKKYDDLHENEVFFLKEILDNEPETKKILSGWFTDEYNQKKTLAKCRFGGLNFTPDLKNGIADPDNILCPKISDCIGFGVVCKPLKYKGIELTSFDIKAIKLLSSSKKNTVIADELDIPIGSFEIYRTRLYKKMEITTKQELAGVAFKIGLI